MKFVKVCFNSLTVPLEDIVIRHTGLSGG